MNRLALLRALLLTSAVLASGFAAGAAESVPSVETTSRLNLRTCPSTDDCAIIYTLPVETRLSVLGGRGEWIEVAVTGTSDRGWVHSDYVKLVPAESEPAFHKFFANLTVDRLALILWAVALLLLSRRWISLLSVRRIIFSFLAYSAMGFLVIFTQFGRPIASAIKPLVDLGWISWLWEATTISRLSYDILVAIALSAALLILLFSPGGAAGRRALLWGAATGLLVVPAFLAAVGLAVGILWLVAWVCKWIAIALWYLIWPLRWLIENALVPLFAWISKPFVWLWEVALLPLIKFISPPFVWLWQTILDPVLRFLQRFAFQPVMVLIATVLAVVLLLSPLAVAGMAAVDGTRRAFRGFSGSDELFGQGVVIGLVGLDLSVAILLSRFGLIEAAVPGMAAFAVAAVVLGVGQTLFFRRQGTFEFGDFRKMAHTYMKTSGLEACYACVMVPLVVLASLSQDG